MAPKNCSIEHCELFPNLCPSPASISTPSSHPGPLAAGWTDALQPCTWYQRAARRAAAMGLARSASFCWHLFVVAEGAITPAPWLTCHGAWLLSAACPVRTCVCPPMPGHVGCRCISKTFAMATTPACKPARCRRYLRANGWVGKTGEKGPGAPPAQCWAGWQGGSARFHVQRSCLSAPGSSSRASTPRSCALQPVTRPLPSKHAGFKGS